MQDVKKIYRGVWLIKADLRWGRSQSLWLWKYLKCDSDMRFEKRWQLWGPQSGPPWSLWLLVLSRRNERARSKNWRQVRGWRLWGVNNDDSYEDGDPKGLYPCDCGNFWSMSGRGSVGDTTGGRLANWEPRTYMPSEPREGSQGSAIRPIMDY